jgi:hypothetical protein
VSDLEDCWGPVVMICCCEKQVAEAEDSSGMQRKRNIRCWSWYEATASEDGTGQYGVCNSEMQSVVTRCMKQTNKSDYQSKSRL